ncbi:Sulfur carrier protein ThiS [compost metagenome]
MKLIVNGQSIEWPEPQGTIQQLLEHFGLSSKIVIVEVDERILDKNTYSQFFLLDGMKIELVHFVGGG